MLQWYSKRTVAGDRRTTKNPEFEMVTLKKETESVTIYSHLLQATLVHKDGKKQQ